MITRSSRGRAVSDLFRPPPPEVFPLPSWDGQGTRDTFLDGTYRTQLPVDALNRRRGGQFEFGIEIQKHRADLLRYEEAVRSTAPEVIVETGTREGGSARWFHEHLGLRVMSVDIQRPHLRWVPPSVPGVVYVRGSSVDPNVVDMAALWSAGRRTMVTLDSDHHAPHVVEEIRFWAPLVSPGCHLVIEDGCFDVWEPQWATIGGSDIPRVGGPLAAINKMLGVLLDLGFVRDEHIEGRYPISHSPCGWWRRDG